MNHKKTFVMKREFSLGLIKMTMLVSLLGLGSLVFAQGKDGKVIADSKTAMQEFITTDKQMKNFFDNSYGYVIFPNVGKGGIGVGGAAGNGVAYERGQMAGMAKMTQVTVGLQWGGQAYREVIFFESKADMDRFKQNKIELSAQASAVAATV